MKIGEFFATLGFEVDDKNLNKFEGSLLALPKRFAVVAAAAAGALFAIDKFTESSIRSATALRNFTMQTGESAQKLQQWQNAAQLANLGASAEDVSGSIMALEQNIAAIKLGGGNIAPFQMLGVNPFTDAFSVLDQLRDRVQGLDRGVAVNLMQQMGISPEMINVLMLSSEEFERFNDVIKKTPEQVKALNKLGVEIKFLKMQFTQWKDTLVADLSPALISITKFLAKLLESMGAIAGMIFDLIRGFFDLASGLAAATGSVNALAIAAGILALKLLPVTASLAALFLILEDIAVFREGGSSVLGRMVKGFQFLQAAIAKGMMMVGKTIRKYLIDPILEGIQLVEELIEKLPDLDSTMKSINLFDNLGDLFRSDERASNLVPTNQLIEKGNIVNNNINLSVNSTADAQEVASLVVRRIQQESYNFGYADVNNGALG